MCVCVCVCVNLVLSLHCCIENTHTCTNTRLTKQLEDARKGNKEGSRERTEKVAAAQSKIEV